MIPFGNRAVTLLHKTADGYQVVALTGCSWQDTSAQTMGDKSVTRTAETTCRIPAGQQKPAPGDLLVLGEAELAARNEVELIRLRESLLKSGKAAFRAQRVSDNSRMGLLPHYAASGE